MGPTSSSWPAVNEAYGMALLEAQARGCPVVAGAFGGVPSVVRDGETGPLTPPGDASAFAARCGSSSSTPTRGKLGRAARTFVIQERTLGMAAERLRALLMPLLAAAMSARILIVVTHLLGAGHLTRAAALGRAFAREGHAVTLVSGGMPTPLATRRRGVRPVPPVRTAGTAFGDLLDPEGQPVEPGSSIQRAGPPGGPRRRSAGHRGDRAVPFRAGSSRRNSEPLLDARFAPWPRPLIACSIRDMLASPSKPERKARRTRISTGYDLVLVHGDPDLVPLEASWPVDERVRPFVRYTGYVDEDERRAARSAAAFSFRADRARRAHRCIVRRSRRREIPDQPWRVLLGSGDDEDAFRAIPRLARPRT